MTFKFFDESSNNEHPGDKPFSVEAFKIAKANGYEGVIIKATEGIDYKNPYCLDEASNARDADMHVGFYHYDHPSQATGKEHAEFCWEFVKDCHRDLGISCDLEVTEGKTWDELAVFVEEALEFFSALEVGSPLYSNLDFLDNMPGAPFHHKLWLAEPSIHTPRLKCWAWQNNWSTNVPGIGICDVDIYYGN